MHASRGPARPGEVSTAAPAVPVFFWSRAAPTPAPRRIQVIYTKTFRRPRKNQANEEKSTESSRSGRRSRQRLARARQVDASRRGQGATAKDVRAQSFGGTPSASGGVTLRGGNGPAGAGRAPAGAGAPAATGAANDARSVRPALRGRRFAGLASPGVPWSKVRLSSDESSGPPRMSSKNGSWQSSATVDRRSGTSCVEINQRVRLC